MYYHGTKITMENYKEVFNVCTPDILDEIRSAIIDDVDIVRYINGCGKDNYKLGQIRLAIREGLPKRYLLSSMQGTTIHYLRSCNNHRVDFSIFDRYIKGGHLLIDPESFNCIALAVAKGADISDIDFMAFSKDVIKVVTLGVLHGYPMKLCENRLWMTEDYIHLIMKGMQLDIDMLPFIDEKWDEDVIKLILESSLKVDINTLLGYITPKIDISIIRCLLNALQSGVDLGKLAFTDSDGYCIYNEYQLSVLIEALKNNVVDTELFNPSLSDMDMQKILDKKLKNP